MPLLNQKAPDFTLFNSEKQAVTLSTLEGSKVLLLFFPFAFTNTCTKELCSVRDELTWYNEVNAKIFGISTDALYSLAKYKAEQNLNFDLLADFNKEVCALYGARYEEYAFGMKGVAKRAAFVIDEKGMVKYEEVLDNAGALPDFDKIKNALT